MFNPFAQNPRWADLRQIWHSRSGCQRNHTYQIFHDWLRSVDSVGVEICPLPLTRPVAVNTALALPRIVLHVYTN